MQMCQSRVGVDTFVISRSKREHPSPTSDTVFARALANAIQRAHKVA